MESQREVKRQYAKLMHDVANDDFFKVDLASRVNCYICLGQECGHITKTKEVDAGVTPMQFYCEKCGQVARSTFYKDVAPVQDPTIEWYRPTLAEVMKYRKLPQMLRHILSGGLAYRHIPKK